MCLVAETDSVLVGELNEWVANSLGPGQTSGLQIFGRSFLLHAVSRSDVIVVISGWLFSGTFVDMDGVVLNDVLQG